MEKTKIRIKSELEITIKVSDSKNVKIVSDMKKVESVIQNINIKQQKFQQILAKQKRLSEIWFFFYPRENDLINQKIRTVRVLDKLIFFPLMITKQNPPKVLQKCFNQIPELNNVDFFQILDGFDFLSIPISAPATFQK